MKRVLILFIAMLILFLGISCADSSHIHTYETDYSMDDVYHWKAATCEHDVTADKAKHAFSVTDKSVDYENSKECVTYECWICHYEKKVYNDIEHSHSFKQVSVVQIPDTTKCIITYQCTVCGFEKTSTQDTSDEFKVISIEQTGDYGDGTLFKYGDFEILIDGGNTKSQKELSRVLSEYVTDKKIEILILSHPHSDHYGGFKSSTNNTLWNTGITQIDQIIDNGVDNSGSMYTTEWVNKVRNFYISKGSTYTPVQKLLNGNSSYELKIDDNLSVGFFDSGFLPTSTTSSSEPNEQSIPAVVRYKEYNFFMFGDLPTSAESRLLKMDDQILLKDGTVNIFKAAHHGSAGANSDALLRKLKVNYCFASAGIMSNNTKVSARTQQHPYDAAVRRIINQVGKDNFYWNGTMGTIEITLNNSVVTFKGNGRKACNYYQNNVLVDPSSEKDLPYAYTKWANGKF